MATKVFMPALGMAQETGTLVRWLKADGDVVHEGEVIAEIQTDKAIVELEARANGVLTNMTVQEGQDAPVGGTIAQILASGEEAVAPASSTQGDTALAQPVEAARGQASEAASAAASPLATRIAAEHGVDLRAIPTNGGRVQKADVLAYLGSLQTASAVAASVVDAPAGARLAPASPKARRLAHEQQIDMRALSGSGPMGAVLTRDVLAFTATGSASRAPATALQGAGLAEAASATAVALHPVWRVMAERTTQSWQQIPHFFLLREVNASRLIAWREGVRRQQAPGVTYTDLLVKVVAETLRAHPRMNASWQGGGIVQHNEIAIGIAVATDDGLVVPVIPHADELHLAEIARRREDVVRRAQAGKQCPDDLMGATFTISNLGMYGVDAFNAIVPGPQAGILAVGRIAERVVPLHGAPAIQPMMTLSLSCDHRVVDGARGAAFLSALADLIEEPLALLS